MMIAKTPFQNVNCRKPIVNSHAAIQTPPVNV